MTAIIYATTNPGKFSEVQKLFAGYRITIHSATDYNVNIDVEETGTTLEANAILKAESYRDAIQENAIVLGDDTGLEIDALGGEPGIKVRRWKGYKMTDDEIIDYCLLRLKDVAKVDRTAQFRTVIAVAQKGQPTQTFAGVLPGMIVTHPHTYREAGLPFQPLFYATEYSQMLYQIHSLSTAEKLTKNIVTHRERAIIASLTYLSKMI